MLPLVSTRQPERLRVPRGSEARWTNHMEQLQFAYLEAVAAAAGCNVLTPIYDEGVDVEVHHSNPCHHAIPERKARLEVQLKATSGSAANGCVAARMSAKRFREFALADPYVPRIVVIMRLPRRQEHWVFADHRALGIFHLAYWVNLAGRPIPPDDQKFVTVHAPNCNVFDDVSLAQIMERVGRGERP